MDVFRSPLQFRSIQTKLLLILLGVFVPMLLFLVASNLYASSLVRRQADALNSNTITLYMKELDVNFSYLEKQMSRLTALDADFRTLETARSDKDYYYASQNVTSAISELLLTTMVPDAVFVFASERATYLDKVDSEDSYGQLLNIRRFLREYLQSGLVNIGEWFPEEIDGAHYFFRILKSDSTYIGVWVGMDKLLSPFLSPELVRLNYVLFADSDGKSISELPEPFSDPFALGSVAENIYVDRNGERYICIDRPSTHGRFSLLAFISEAEVLAGLLTFRTIFWCLIVLILLLSAAALLLQHVTVVRPVKNLVGAMRNVQSGNWDVTLDDARSSEEFRMLNRTYSAMIREIRELKIGMYEEKLMKQRRELQFYQLQIRPHFLINSLNIIYNQAQFGKYAVIQKMSHYLIRHFQYTMKSGASLVSLKDELFYTQNYLAIQELRFPDVLETFFDVDDALLMHEVPPLSIQTFVENSVKYAMTIEEPVMIGIRVKACEENPEILRIAISDSGPGFSPENLEALAKCPDADVDEHIGINNVRHRLRLLFGDNARLIIGNSPEGGAIVEMLLPRTQTSEVQPYGQSAAG